MEIKEKDVVLKEKGERKRGRQANDKRKRGKEKAAELLGGRE